VLLAIGPGEGLRTASGCALLVTAVPTLLAPLFWNRLDGGPLHLAGEVLVPPAAAWGVAVLWFGLKGAPLRLHPLLLTALLAIGMLTVVCQCARVIAGAACRAGAPPASAREWARWSVTAMLWLASAAPLWLGPVADLGARVNADVPSRILAASPLAHLATAAGYDLLRNQWFYAHSSLGALQVGYPAVRILLLSYAFAAATLTLLAVPFGGRSTDTSAGPQPMTSRER
jgi:hypothetical protein